MKDEADENRRAWDLQADAYQAEHREQLARAPMAWGIWSLPEDELQLIGDVCDRDVLEYGCGGAQWSIALAKRGARAVGLDNSERQLRYAREAVEAAGVEVTLVHTAAEATPFADASFDIVFCDHGAMTFANPERTLPEVARILRPGGILAFSMEHPLHAACWDDTANALSRTLQHSYFALGRVVDSDDGMVSFQRPISEFFRLFTEHGFAVERMVEPQPAAGAATSYEGFASWEWARDFPAEIAWRLRRRDVST